MQNEPNFYLDGFYSWKVRENNRATRASQWNSLKFINYSTFLWRKVVTMWFDWEDLKIKDRDGQEWRDITGQSSERSWEKWDERKK